MISLILAMDRNRLIGKDHDLPWNYPEDLQYFKKTTFGKTVLMGRETFLSILKRNHKPLPGRHSVIASRRPFVHEGVEVVGDLFGYLKTPRTEEVFVIGGKTIYELAFPLADRLYITYIDAVHEGDVYLNEWDLSPFHLIHETISGIFRFCIYERKR